MLSNMGKSGEFKAKSLETALLHTWGKLPWPKVVLVGLGDPKQVNLSLLSRAAATAARRALQAGCDRLTFALPVTEQNKVPLSSQVHSVVEGTKLGPYRFDQFKGKSREPQKPLREVLLLLDDPSSPAARDACRHAEAIADATNYARDIANLPGNCFHPESFAAEARRLGRACGLRVTVWEKRHLQQQGFGGLLAVGGGSAHEPRFIRLDYHPPGPRRQARPLVLVGKAITFDSGGISIKPSEKMDEMKFDKCGGVTVLGVLRAVAALRLPVPVTGLIAAAENMLSATAYRPGDIVTTYNGTTIEVLNTDAEGRIVLGDALGYATKLRPQAVVDLATLTGACVVALGPCAAGLFSNHETLSQRLQAAAEASGERLWPFPLWDDYHEMIKSPVADIKNTAGRYGAAITAAAFLQKFVGQTPWAHLDIAGTAWLTEDKPYAARGGTAFGVRLLCEMLRQWKPL